MCLSLDFTQKSHFFLAAGAEPTFSKGKGSFFFKNVNFPVEKGFSEKHVFYGFCIIHVAFCQPVQGVITPWGRPLASDMSSLLQGRTQHMRILLHSMEPSKGFQAVSRVYQEGFRSWLVLGALSTFNELEPSSSSHDRVLVAVDVHSATTHANPLAFAGTL